MANSSNRAREKSQFGQGLMICFNLVGWALIVVALIIIGIARPEMSTVYDDLHRYIPRKRWDMDMIKNIGPIMFSGVGLSLIGLSLHFILVKTKQIPNNYPVSLIITGVLSLVGLFIILSINP